jgi:hypothetical protein
MAVRSLGLSYAFRSQVDAIEPAHVVLALEYADGSVDSRRFTLPAHQSEWSRRVEKFPVVREPPRRVLKSSSVSVEAPAGRGTLLIDDLELTHDPLHDPLEPGRHAVTREAKAATAH